MTRHVEITAHRGFSRFAPENTVAALLKAAEAGADWVEVDAQETADGVVVLMHDADLLRTTGDPRRLSEVGFEELRRLDAGSRFGAAYRGERVPTLVEAIEAVRGRMRLNVELKYSGEDPRLAPGVVHILREAGVEGECLVTSMELGALAVVRRENPNLLTGAILTAPVTDVGALGVDVLSVVPRLVTPGFMARAGEIGLSVHVWTVDDEGEALRLVALGVDNLITNDPERMGRVLRAPRG